MERRGPKNLTELFFHLDRLSEWFLWSDRTSEGAFSCVLQQELGHNQEIPLRRDESFPTFQMDIFLRKPRLVAGPRYNVAGAAMAKFQVHPHSL